MKKITLVVLAGLLTASAFAQTPAPVAAASPAQKTDMKDLRTDVRSERKDKRERRADLKAGNTAAAKDETNNIKADKANKANDKADAKADGVKHPVRRADRQIHRQNVRH
jgi:hypothetical protein